MGVSGNLQFALDLLFIAAGLFAVAVMLRAWRQALPTIRALAQEIALLDNVHEPVCDVRFQIDAAGVLPAHAQAIPPRQRVVSVRKPYGRTFVPIAGRLAAA
ncbi:MAG: hypothetical protein ABI673_11405 [Novosphingobium sp.]